MSLFDFSGAICPDQIARPNCHGSFPHQQLCMNH
jgi:hypothetical protein